jgi:hypothetical protein
MKHEPANWYEDGEFQVAQDNEKDTHAIPGIPQSCKSCSDNEGAITVVGYRINSHRTTEFRKWATEILHEFIIKHFGQDYFDELLERIREIRLSERRLYQKITDIYALSADYDKNDDVDISEFELWTNGIAVKVHEHNSM